MTDLNERLQRAQNQAHTWARSLDWRKPVMPGDAMEIIHNTLEVLKESEPSTDDLQCCNCQRATSHDSPQCEDGCGALCDVCARTDNEGVYLCPDCLNELRKEGQDQGTKVGFYGDFPDAEKEPAQLDVRHPDGGTWYKRPSGHTFFTKAACYPYGADLLTPAEAFQPGATAEWKCDGSIVRGPVVNSSVIATTIGIGFFKVQCPTKDLTLVRPAPDPAETIDGVPVESIKEGVALVNITPEGAHEQEVEVEFHAEHLYGESPDEPLVRDPDGRVWHVLVNPPFKAQYEALPDKADVFGSRPITRAEAFQLGALVLWRNRHYPKVHIQAYVEDSGKEGVCMMGEWRRYESMVLVEPAPEAKPCQP